MNPVREHRISDFHCTNDGPQERSTVQSSSNFGKLVGEYTSWYGAVLIIWRWLHTFKRTLNRQVPGGDHVPFPETKQATAASCFTSESLEAAPARQWPPWPMCTWYRRVSVVVWGLPMFGTTAGDLTAVNINFIVLLPVGTSYLAERQKCYWRTCCLHLQNRKVKMEPFGSSVTLVPFYQTTRHYIWII
jgi:hypothetical protein